MSDDPKDSTIRHNCTDEEALHWLRDGSAASESKAIGCLYRRLLEKLRPWIHLKNGSADDTHDALTEALVAVVGMIRENKYQEQGKLENYLFRVAQFKFYDICRKRRKGGGDISLDEIFPGGVPRELEADPFEKNEADAEANTRLLRLQHCLEQIGERCKERLVRFWYMEQSHEEIAQSMGDASTDVSKVMKGKCQSKLAACMGIS